MGLDPTMKNLIALFAIALAASFSGGNLFAGGDSPSKSRGDELAAKSGTNVRGESGDFESYLNESGGQEKESNSVDLVDLGEDAKIAAGGDDAEVGLKMGY